MQGLMEDFLRDVSLESAPFFGEIYNNLGDMVMYFEKYIDNALQKDAIGTIYTYFYIFFLSLLALKALRKGFSVYLLCRDGDSDESPKEIVVSIMLAISSACFFPFIYPLCADIALDFANKVITILFGTTKDPLTETILGFIELAGADLIGIILILVYLISLIIFWFQVLRRSVEMFALRISFPIACIGFIDGDGGVAKSYMKILCQSTLTTIYQMCCFTLSLAIMGNGHPMFALGAMISAVSGNILMSTILSNTGGSGNVGHKVQQAVSTVNILRSFMGGK